MKDNLFDFADKNFDENKKDEKLTEELKKRAEKIDKTTKENINNLYNKYKNYSEQDLLNEFLATSKDKIKDGSLSKEKLEGTINTLSPYITSEQKSFLDNLIKKLEDD